jgi:hypothetical protein
MKPLVIVSCLLLFCAGVLQAQTPLKARWDYDDIELPNISTFQVKVDNAATYTQIGIPTAQVLPDTTPGTHTYEYVLPALTSGTHAFTVRACNATDCSFDLSTSFRLIGNPKNLRIGK